MFRHQAQAQRKDPVLLPFRGQDQRPADLATIAVCLDPQELAELLEFPESLDDPECLECLEILELRREFAPKSHCPPVPHAHKALRDSLAHLDHQEMLDRRDPQGHQALTPQQVHRVRKVQRVHQVHLDPTAPLANPGRRPQVPKLSLEIPDRLEILAHKDPPDSPAKPDNLEQAELPEKKAHLAQLDSPADLEIQAHPDPKVHPVAKASEEFVRNIARWMAGYFSKTEREDKRRFFRWSIDERDDDDSCSFCFHFYSIFISIFIKFMGRKFFDA